MENFIPVNEPLIGENEKELVMKCLETGWISSEGSFVKDFENQFSKNVDRKFGISCSSGTAALDIAFASLDIGPGDEVIIPTFTIISCASAVVRTGAKPVLVDCDPYTFNSKPEDITGLLLPPVDLSPVLLNCKVAMISRVMVQLEMFSAHL